MESGRSHIATFAFGVLSFLLGRWLTPVFDASTAFWEVLLGALAFCGTLISFWVWAGRSGSYSLRFAYAAVGGTAVALVAPLVFMFIQWCTLNLYFIAVAITGGNPFAEPTMMVSGKSATEWVAEQAMPLAGTLLAMASAGWLGYLLGRSLDFQQENATHQHDRALRIASTQLILGFAYVLGVISKQIA